MAKIYFTSTAANVGFTQEMLQDLCELATTQNSTDKLDAYSDGSCETDNAIYHFTVDSDYDITIRDIERTWL